MAKRRQLWLWVLSFVLWYTLFGFFVAPRIIKAVVLWQVPKQIGRQVALQKIKLNPFAISIAIDGLSIAERNGQPFAGWDEVYVNLDPTGLIHRELVISQIAISNAFVHVQANRDGSFNFSDILQRFPTEPSPKKQDTGKPMIVRVGQLRITGSKAVYDDLMRATPFSTAVGPIDVTLHDFSTSPDNQNPYGFTAVTESREKFSWRGFFYLGPIRSSGEFAIEGMALKKYAPYYEHFVNLTIHDGWLDVSASYRVEFADRLSVAQVSNLTVTVRSLQLAERGGTTNLIEIPNFTVAGTFADAVAQIVDVGSVTTSGARFNIRRFDDGSINLLKLLPSPATNAAAPGTNAPPPAWAATVHSVAVRDYGFDLAGFFGEQHLAWEALQLTGIRAQTAPLSLTVNAIALTNAAFDYADNSLQPPVSVTMTQVIATVNELSSDPNERADLRVTGRIGNLGSIEATGRINPLNIDAATELQAALHQMDLVPVGSYSGKYAGYDVRKGKLNVAVRYAIEQRKLDAQNSIEVDQFTFGEKVDSPDAVKLPVKLAVAILKDRNGKITLDVPVEGRVDDPQFRYWGAVWHVLGNLFTRIFTAPFSLLGSMFGGGSEELGWQEFAPGSSELLPEQTKKLDVLINAMTERPALNIEIEGNVDKDKDREPLKRRKLHEIVTQRAGNTNDYVAWLRIAYAEALPQIQLRLAPPPPPARIESNVQDFGVRPATPSKRARKVAAELSVEQMENNYFLILDVTPDDYRQLALERAKRVQSYLVETRKIEADRVFLADISKRPPPSAGTRAIFTLQ
jgi:hypothetical protein